jgi:hypothetical protein
MPDKTNLVRLKEPSSAPLQVRTVRFEIHSEDLVFVDSKERLAALFLLALVESWNAIAS